MEGELGVFSELAEAGTLFGGSAITYGDFAGARAPGHGRNDGVQSAEVAGRPYPSAP